MTMETANIPLAISQEHFDRVQRLMAGNKKIQPAAVGSDHLLTGLIKCGKCGRAMQYNAYDKWAYYRCGQRSGQALCDAASLRAEPLEAAVLDALRGRFEHLARSLVAESVNVDPARDLSQNLAAVENQVLRLDAQERRINQDYREDD